ncbi:GDSL esterase/lipase At2g40250-like [Humulus lupulus]|uniref:GDSL esterase/lipase At2g40250-like n=1 Tax=Humulus lupulus TaxID=3486 RepID=UPI002B409F1E|nr:GDSL esterase/lipase At2g40250-like [Humulus lupulus]
MDKKKLIAIFHCFSLLFTLPIISITTASAPPAPSIRAVFAFGDSTIDPGNNNGLTGLSAIFTGNHPPYGKDLPRHIPTGRFSNGKLATDFLASNLGIKEFLPPYFDPTLSDAELATGVSFASAGAGIDNTTNTAFRGVVSTARQLEYFDEAMQRIERYVGKNRSEELVRDSLFVFSAGFNDVLYNQVLGLLNNQIFQDSSSNDASNYQDFLVQTLGSYIQTLYSKGARNFGVAGQAPIGCLPLVVTVGSILPSFHMLQRVCVERLNLYAQAYNTKLQALLTRLQQSLPASNIAYFGVYDPLMDMINNPLKYGFVQTLQGCCGTGLFEVGPVCLAGMATCLDASKYIFWDSAHPTQAAYMALANQFSQQLLLNMFTSRIY